MGNSQDKLDLENISHELSSINFAINGIPQIVNPLTSPDYHPDGRLVDYIRDKALLKGTKAVCREGGCGACLCVTDNGNGGQLRAVNSCLVPLYSVDGWNISTIESLGNLRDGYHEIQKSIVKEGGTQCGFCTPGMCMNMYGLVESKKGDFTGKDVEDAFDGNICRCTGYRPIIQAFKGMAKESSEYTDCDFIDQLEVQEASEDIEVGQGKELQIKFTSGQLWVKPLSLVKLFQVIQHTAHIPKGFKFIGGNTGQGVIPDETPYQVYIDLGGLPPLKKVVLTESQFIIGGGITISEWIELLKRASNLRGYQIYANQFITHLSRVANTPVRNLGTIGGNLMIKHKQNGFPSDIFTLLEGIGAKIFVSKGPGAMIELTPEQFLKHDMRRCLLTEIHLPNYAKNPQMSFKSFKISRRFQNSHAYVNAAFLSWKGGTSIVFGGINPGFIHAHGTEALLKGKSLREHGDGRLLKEALNTLDKELDPDWILPDGSPEYRKTLALGLFYKFYLGIIRGVIDPRLKSAPEEIRRLEMTAQQSFPPPDPSVMEPPLGEPLPKYEGHLQASGEAQYVNDMPMEPNELAGYFVLATVGKADLAKIDASEALMVPGVIDFISAKDVPGKNECLADILGDAAPYVEPEEIFASSKIKYAGQVVGLILARTREAGREGVRRVKVSYKNVEKPVLDFDPSLYTSEEELRQSMTKLNVGNSKNIKGQLRIGAQYHFHMECHVSRVVPKENGQYDLFTSTQWMNHSHMIVSEALGVQASCVNVEIKRLGGAFGAKITRGAQIAAAAAVGAYKARVPVRIQLDLESNMRMVGKRPPYLINYDVEIDANTGKITKNNSTYICDSGCTNNENTGIYAEFFIQSCYKADAWAYKGLISNTNTHSNTWCRSPGSVEMVLMIEHVMEHIAKDLGKDPMEIRAVNYLQKGDNLVPFNTPLEEENLLPQMIEEIKASGNYAERVAQIEKFNSQHRWKKRGINLMPMRFPIFFFYWGYNSLVSVYHLDGSVSVTHAAVEMGQGVNTKIAQVVASSFGIPIEMVKVKPNNNHIAPNTIYTGGSISTNLTTWSVFMACENLKEKMEPVRKRLPKETPWVKIVQECWKEDIDLTGNHRPSPRENLESYSVWTVILSEVEIDVLTGEMKLARVDLIEDCGRSLNPLSDLGQIEGGLIFGFGYWLTEKVVYDPDNGQNLSAGTWNYKVPLPRDIPEDFRVIIRKNTEDRIPKGTLGAKGVGEPPICLAISAVFALRNAIDAARKEIGAPTDFYRIDLPLTVENIQKLCMTSKDKMVL